MLNTQYTKRNMLYSAHNTKTIKIVLMRPQTGVSNCGSLCTNRGRYCMTDPDFDTKAGVSGADVVRESLRQKCIWNIYGGENAPLLDQVRNEKCARGGGGGKITCGFYCRRRLGC